MIEILFTKEMQPKLWKLAATMMGMAADQFSNHGCNDIDDRWFDGWTEEEKARLCRDVQNINTHGRMDDPYPENVEQIGDDGLMRYFEEKFKGFATPSAS